MAAPAPVRPWGTWGLVPWSRALVPELSLLLLAAATRLPLLSPAQGESDSARFVVAVWQWLRFGPHANSSHVTYGYYHVLAPGYFALAHGVVNGLRISPANLSLCLNCVSAVVALLSAPLLYRIGSRFLAPLTAWVAAALFLLAPGFWWLGLEAHPQGLALLLALIALDQFVLFHAHPLAARHGVLAAAALAAALLMRGDSLLLAPAFPVLAWLGPNNSGRSSHARRLAFELAATFSAAAATFLLARGLILQSSFAATHGSLLATVAQYWGRSFWLKQLIPIVTAVGPAVFAFALIGLGLALCRRATAAGLLVAAAVPGLAFWLIIEGNNTRHIIDFWLLLLWAACLGWQVRKPRWLPAVAALAVALNWVLIPPNSNANYYPSPDLFASHQLHAAKVAALAAIIPTLRAHAASAPGPVCYLGYATTPFVQQDLALSPDPPTLTTLSHGWRRVHWPACNGSLAATAYLAPAYNHLDYLHQAARCRRIVSVEFTPAGHRLRYFGAELSLPAPVASFESWLRRREVQAEGWR